MKLGIIFQRIVEGLVMKKIASGGGILDYRAETILILEFMFLAAKSFGLPEVVISDKETTHTLTVSSSGQVVCVVNQARVVLHLECTGWADSTDFGTVQTCIIYLKSLFEASDANTVPLSSYNELKEELRRHKSIFGDIE